MMKHIAIIMDGNGRWATERGLSRSEGHLAGVKQIGKVVEAASKLGIESLTLYAFSTENWKRPAAEVNALSLWSRSFPNLNCRRCRKMASVCGRSAEHLICR